MKIGIVGSNDRAVAIGRLFQNGGHEITFGDPSANERARQIAEEFGVESEAPYRQAMDCDLVVFAVPRREIDRVLMAVGSGARAVIVDAVEDERGDAYRSGAEMLARKLDTHRIVRALIGLPQSNCTIPVCGDDAVSKQIVERAFQACECVTSDLGPLANAVELEAA